MADQNEGQVVQLFPAGRPVQIDPPAQIYPQVQINPPVQIEPLWRELAGQVIRAERQRRHRTLAQVADRAGVSPQYLSEVERGRKDASSEMLDNICGALDLRLRDLLVGSARILLSRPHRSPAPAVRPGGVSLLAA